MKRTKLEDFLNNLEHSNKSQIIELCQIIQTQIPQLEPNIKWNAPNFAIRETDCITFRLAPKDLLQIILHRGAKVVDNCNFEFADVHNIIEWKTKDRGIIDLKANKISDEKLIDALRNWVNAV
jgi:uncharacterized protein YdhG (YjbR/CyaY superfamily)